MLPKVTLVRLARWKQWRLRERSNKGKIQRIKCLWASTADSKEKSSVEHYREALFDDQAGASDETACLVALDLGVGDEAEWENDMFWKASAFKQKIPEERKKEMV